MTAVALRRWKIPEPTSIVSSFGRDGIYRTGPTEHMPVRDVRVEMYPDANGHTGRAGIINNNTEHPEQLVSNSIVRFTEEANDGTWGVRTYGDEDSLYDTCLVRNAGREHGFYVEPWRGLCRYTDLTSINCAAQGLQLRLTGNRGDTHWPWPKDIEIVRFTGLECGQERGEGRAGFSLSVFEMGPASDVLIDDPLVRTVQQTAVKVHNGVTYNSFGGMLVGYCRSLVVRGGYVGMRPPSDRDTVQLFDFSNKAATRTGPASIEVDGLYVDFGGNIAVREGDGERIEIKNCSGVGKIKVFRHNGTSWRLNRSVPIVAGLSL